MAAGADGEGGRHQALHHCSATQPAHFVLISGLIIMTQLEKLCYSIFVGSKEKKVSILRAAARYLSENRRKKTYTSEINSFSQHTYINTLMTFDNDLTNYYALVTHY